MPTSGDVRRSYWYIGTWCLHPRRGIHFHILCIGREVYLFARRCRTACARLCHVVERAFYMGDRCGALHLSPLQKVLGFVNGMRRCEGDLVAQDLGGLRRDRTRSGDPLRNTACLLPSDDGQNTRQSLYPPCASFIPSTTTCARWPAGRTRVLRPDGLCSPT